MKFDIRPTKNSKFDKPPISKAEIPTKLGRWVVRPRDFMYWMWVQEMAAYPKNRGGRSTTGDPRPDVAPKTVKSVREEFHGWSFGGLTACLIDDGLRKTYSIPDISKLLVADGHGSTMGMYGRWWDGNMTDAELDFPVVLTVAPASEFLRIYTLRNIQVAQTTTQTLNDDDLHYGSAIWNDIVPRLSDEAKALIVSRPSKMLPQLSYVLESWHDRSRNGWDYLTVFRTRTSTKPKALQQAGTLDLGVSDKGFDEIAEAIDWYAKFITSLEEKVQEAGMGAKELRKVKGSAPLFGLVIVDVLSNKSNVLPKDRKPGTMANQTKRNLLKVAQVLPSITWGDDPSMRAQIRDLAKLLRGR